MNPVSRHFHPPALAAASQTIFATVLAVAVAAGSANAGQSAPSDAAGGSVRSSLAYLRRVMDQYHNRFPVYEGISSPAHHFHAWAKLPNATAPVDNGSWVDRPRSGATSIRCVYTHRPGDQPSFGGFYFQNGTLSGEERSPQPTSASSPMPAST